MHLPASFYQMQQGIAQRLPALSATQAADLTLWVYGTVLAQSACQNAVLTALQGVAAWNTLRQRLREGLYNGADKAAPCQTQVAVEACFPALLRWVLALWKAPTLLVALDATAHKDHLVALVVSVLYRGSAIPIAWALLPAGQKGAWEPHWERLLHLLAPGVSSSLRVLVLCDRGLWSPALSRQICAVGWHPLMRVQNDLIFTPAGLPRLHARDLVVAGQKAWMGSGVAFGSVRTALPSTLLALWLPAQSEPCLVLTDLPVYEAGLLDYGLRMWIEAGFAQIKRMGWQWERTQRTDPQRASRHFLVLAVATLWTLACGTRVEDGRAAPALLAPDGVSAAPTRRVASIFRQGLFALRRQLLQNYVWRRLWLAPQPLRQPPPTLQIVYHSPPDTG